MPNPKPGPVWPAENKAGMAGRRGPRRRGRPHLGPPWASFGAGEACPAPFWPKLGGPCFSHRSMLLLRSLTNSTMSSRRVHPRSRASTITWSTSEARWHRLRPAAFRARTRLRLPRAPASLGRTAVWEALAGQTGLGFDIADHFRQRGLVRHDRGAGGRRGIERLGRRQRRGVHPSRHRGGHPARRRAGYRVAGRARRRVHGKLAGVAW